MPAGDGGHLCFRPLPAAKLWVLARLDRWTGAPKSIPGIEAVYSKVSSSRTYSGETGFPQSFPQEEHREDSMLR
jgi:hypothetical protein